MGLISETPLHNNTGPSKFLESIDSHKHIVMFYEEPEWAQRIGFEFIKNGLVKGEHCIYAMSDEPEIVETNMTDYGIDVKKYKENNLLHVFKIPDSYDYSADPITEAKEFWKKLMSKSIPPLRIFATFTNELNKHDAVECQTRIEEFLNSQFNTIQGTWICPYDVTKIDSKNRLKWIKKLIASHESAIFAPSIGKGMAFDL